MWEEYRLHRTPKLFEQVIYLEKIALFCENVERVAILPHTKIIWTGTFFLEKIALFCGNVERLPILPYTKIIWTGTFI